MATFERYHLTFRAPVHLATRGIGIEMTELTVHSDTLFSALLSGLQYTHGPEMVDYLLDQCQEDGPPFVLSSTFPWASSVFLLPRPRQVPAGGAARRARWVSEAVLALLLRGESPPDADEPLLLGDEGSAWVLPEERAALESLPSIDAGRGPGATRSPRGVAPGDGRFWAIHTVPRVTVDRETQASAVYRAGRTVFRSDAGLYFLVRWRDPDWQPLFEDALAYLADAGLGGERSAGHGQFTYRRETVSLDDSPASPWRVTLGLYHPTPTEIAAGALDPPAAYDLVLRQGWATTADGDSLWRKAVRLIAEGALVQQVGEVAGELVDVAPDRFSNHRIVRCGLALTLGMAASTGGSP